VQKTATDGKKQLAGWCGYPIQKVCHGRLKPPKE